MSTMAMLLALSALGVESGYEPATDGQLEYIVQIEPQLVPQLAKGNDITSELPRGLTVRHFRVTIGTGKLPKQPVDGRSTRNRFPTNGKAPAEPPGIETQDVRVGYQPLAKGDGEYVIEITPTGLGDLDQHDLTGDIPPNLAISRVRISTQPGSAPDATAPPASSAPSEPTIAAGPHLAATDQPPVSQPIITPPAAAIPDPAEVGIEPLTPAEQDELAHPENDPKFQYPVDPLAAPMTSKSTAGPTPAEGVPTLAGPDQAATEPKRPGHSDRRNGQGANRAAPAPLAADPHSTPLAGKNVTYSEQLPGDGPATKHQTQKPSQTEKSSTGALAKGVKGAEEKLADATPPWYTLAVTLLLFLSIGGNLYMGWITWDARNRARALLERFRAGELTLN